MTIEDYYKKACVKTSTGEPFTPNPLQRAVWQKFNESEHPALLVRAGTGTGKTEAILMPALAADRRVIMVMPSKSLIEDMAERVKKICANLSIGREQKFSVTVDMGGSCRRYVCDKGTVTDNEYHRHLFVDDVIITTLDKFLFRLFGYGEPIKSYIFPHRVFGETLGKKPFIIFDEAHDYESVAFANFRKLIEALYTKGKDLCIMSATLPAGIADFLETVDAIDGPLSIAQDEFQKDIQGMTNQDKKLVLCELDAKENVIETMVQEIERRFSAGKRIIARTEFVSDLITLYERLKEKNFNPLVYHGRLTTSQRRKVIKEVIDLQNANKGFLVLATSAIEAGCDFDAHTIVTEFCLPDSLVQLAGRLNRKGTMSDAELVVVGDKLKMFDRDTPALIDVKRYKEVLSTMNGTFQPGMLQEFFKYQNKGDWMGEVLFDMLWNYVYEGDLTCKPLWDRGILITRSWEPSVTLCIGLTHDNIPVNPIQVGIRRISKRMEYDADKNKRDDLKNKKVCDSFSVSADDQWHAELKRAYFNPGLYDESRWSIYPFPKSWISAYETDLLCVISNEFVSDYYDEILGYKKIPEIMLYGYKNGYERILQYKPEIKDGCFKLNTKKYPETSPGAIWFLER